MSADEGVVEAPMANVDIPVVGSDGPSEKRLINLAAEWQTEGHKQQLQLELMKSEVLTRIKNATDLMVVTETVGSEKKEGSAVETQIHLSINDPLSTMSWNELYEVSANVMDEYTKDVDYILNMMDKLAKKQYLWQEAAFVLDSHRGALLFNRSKGWMDAKEKHLEYKRKELDRSAKVIKTTIERLTSK